MANRDRKTVLFLDADDSGQARSAENLFSSVAGKMGSSWQAQSSRLIVASDPKIGDNLAATDLERADRIIGFGRTELQAIVEERFPNLSNKVEYWEEAAANLEPLVMALVARLLGGGERPDFPHDLAQAPKSEPAPAKKLLTAKVGRETSGRRGKGVTTIFDLQLDENGLRELAALLKQKCGTGGTYKDGRIEIQGDQRDRIVAELEKLGYRVKRAGG